MSGQFTDWLNQLALDNKGPVRFRSITRGLPWVGDVVSYPGDVMTATLEMDIRAAPNAPSKLVDVTVGAPTLVGGRTVWPLSLTAAQTAALPMEGDGSGVAEFPIDAVLTPSGSSAQRLFGGIIPVSGFITIPGV
jgi:hypothetical protein